MNRRQFLQLSAAGGASLLLPRLPYAATPNVLNAVQFSNSIYNANRPRVIMVFLYGGASELAGNFTNYDEFKNLSQSSYEDYFGNGDLVTTTNGYWQAAGGDIMEQLTTSNHLNVLRTCFSKVRDDNNNRSHGSCVTQNQRGSYDEETSGIFATLAEVLRRNNIVHQDSVMPFLSMEGNSDFFAEGEIQLQPYLKPLNISETLSNPYSRWNEPSYTDAMDVLAQSMNPPGQIKDAFQKRAELQEFIDTITVTAPAEAQYANNSFARRLRTAISVMDQNEDTLIISTGSGGLGGWDDHNDADNYLTRMNNLFAALRSATIHLDSLASGDNISIIVMGEFGRGVNLNSANGWDHGNLQNVYTIGGSRYFNALGPYGSTALDYTGSVNRLYLKPATSSYWFEPLAVASTIYSMFGITNPQILTDNVGPIGPLLS